ncbi:MAG: FAD-dependent oxidoreductase [Sutterella wadsworthensis]
MTFARNKSKEGPDRLRRRLLAAGAAAALCPAHALAGHREDLQQDWDVIVIGTGMAGLTAAVSAREAGAVRVLLLEKGPLVGGHTLYAAGSVAVLSPRRQAPIGFTDSVELWIQDAIKAGGTVLRPHITRIATESEAAVDWLEGLGLVMTRTAYQAVGDMHPRSVTALGLAAGRRFVIALHENARMLGVTTALNTRAVRLGRAEEDGLVRVAVKRTLPGGEVRDEVLRAGGIVIATGGFTADVGRRLLYDDRLTVDVPTTANPQGLYFDGATGDGLDLGAMVGGHTVGMSNIILLPYAGGRLLDYVGGDIYVNSSGERFMNEEMPIYDISEAILAQPGRTCWVITDSRSRKGRDARPQARRRHGAPLEHDRGDGKGHGRARQPPQAHDQRIQRGRRQGP